MIKNNNILSKIKKFVKEHQADIILVIGVVLISLLSFALGYIVAREQEKTPLIFEEITVNEFRNSFSSAPFDGLDI